MSGGVLPWSPPRALAAAVIGALLALLLPLAAAGAQVIAIVGGRVHTLSAAGVIEGGTVLIRDDRIVAVGKNVDVPEGALVVNAEGAWVTPGLFNAYTHLGLVENEDVRSTMDHAAAEAPFDAGFDVSRGVNGESTLIAIARLRGVTRAAIFPIATRSIFAGLGALIRLDSSQDAVFGTRSMAVVELGAQGAALAGGARGAAWTMLCLALDEARDEAAVRKGKPGSQISDVDSEALTSIVRGEVPLLVHVERTADIRNALDLRERYPELRLVLLGANEGWRLAEQIATARVPVILDSFANLPIDFEMMAATQESAARLAAAGVLVAIAPLYRFHAAVPHNAGLVTQYAGNAVANGLPWKQALEAITLNPARIFGVADRLGSLEPGKIADIVVWSGDPLELDSRPDAVFIAGLQMPMVSRQTRLRDRYRDLTGNRPYAYRR